MADGALTWILDYGGLDPTAYASLTAESADLDKRLLQVKNLPTDVTSKDIAQGNHKSLREWVGNQAALALVSVDDDKDIEPGWRKQLADGLRQIIHLASEGKVPREKLLQFAERTLKVAAIGAIKHASGAAKEQLAQAESWLSQAGPLALERWRKAKERLAAIERYWQKGVVPPGQNIQSMLRAVIVEIPTQISAERDKGSDLDAVVEPIVEPVKKVGEAVSEVGKEAKNTAHAVNTAVIVLAAGCGVAALVALLLLLRRRRSE